MAAGLSLKEQNIEILRQTLNEKSNLSEDDLLEKVSIDMQLPLGYISEELVNSLELLEPFGKGNPKPMFAEKDITIVRKQVIGQNRNMLKLFVRDAQGTAIEALYFGDAEQFERYLQEHGEKLSVTYYPSINEYMGNKKLQIIIQNYQ